MEITIGMKRILPTLLTSGLLYILFAAPAVAQNENPTLHPEAPHGITLWGNRSHRTSGIASSKTTVAAARSEEEPIQKDSTSRYLQHSSVQREDSTVMIWRSVAPPLQTTEQDSTLQKKRVPHETHTKKTESKKQTERDQDRDDEDDEKEDNEDASKEKSAAINVREHEEEDVITKITKDGSREESRSNTPFHTESVSKTTIQELNPTDNEEKDDEDDEVDVKKEVTYVPKVDGAVKAKMEVSLYDGEYRFNVRNTRFGVSGNVSPNMFYRIQVDFNNEGKLNILDSYVGYRTGGLDIRLGQQQYHFSTELDRGPNTNIFANRSFLAKHLASYYGSELSEKNIVNYVNTLGSRDLGLMTTYQFKKGLPMPLKLYFGIFNGSGINNPSWNKTVNLIGRIEVGTVDAFRAAVSYYNGSAPRHKFVIDRNGTQVEDYLNQKLNMVGAELHYVRGGFFIEGEYARRYLQTTIEQDKLNTVMTAALVHSYYRFEMPHRFVLNYIAPMLRWDIGNNMDYLNTLDSMRETVDANRITVGVNFGFGKKLIHSELRLNYEKYFIGNQPDDFPTNKLLHDKFTLEVVAAF